MPNIKSLPFSDEGLDSLKTALAGVFGRVEDLFGGPDMSEHRNETVCFVGISGYKISEAVYGGHSPAEVTVAVKALGSRDMSASELCDLFDAEALAAISGCGLSVSSIKRRECEYLKENQRYCVCADIILDAETEAGGSAPSVELTLNGEAIGCMTGFEVVRSVKVGETPTLDGGIISRVIGERPVKITVGGAASPAAASGVYSKLGEYLGAGGVDITLSGLSFAGVTLTGLEISSQQAGISKITAEFCGVSGP